MKNLEQTIELVRLIGSPFSDLASEGKGVSILTRHPDLGTSAKRNRIFLLFLESLEKKKLETKSTVLQNEVGKYQNMLVSVSDASSLLTRYEIDHAIYKTVRPYRSATVDIDILILGDVNDYRKAFQTMEQHSYELVVHGPRSTTMKDTRTQIGIDLYEQVAVSNVVYIDKKNLTAYATTLKLPNNRIIKNLGPEADLLCIVAHSIIKEQMYVLSEYYTFLYYLKTLNTDNFLTLAKQNNLTHAVKTHANLTALLHKTAHGTVPNPLRRILDNLGSETFETTRLIKRKHETPHKYHPLTITRSLLEVAKTPKTRNSIATQIYQMLHPTFSKTFLRALIQHATRQTY